jgi:hypothetical protein
MGEKRNAYGILVGRPKGKRPLRRPRHRWVDDIKIYLREMGWGGMNSIDLAQDRDYWSSCEHGNEHSGYITFWEVVEWLRNWRLLENGSAP